MRVVLAVAAGLIMSCSAARIRTGPVVLGQTPQLVTRTQVLLQLRAQVAHTGFQADRIAGAWILPERMGGGLLALWVDQRDRAVIAHFPDGLGSSGTLQMIDGRREWLVAQFWATKGKPVLRYVSFPVLPNGTPAVQFELHLDGKQGQAETELVLVLRYTVRPRLARLFTVVSQAKRVLGNVCARLQLTASGQLTAPDLNRDGIPDLEVAVTLRREQLCDLDGLCEQVRHCVDQRRTVRRRYLWDRRNAGYRLLPAD